MKLINDDCLKAMTELLDNSVDTIFFIVYFIDTISKEV